MIFRLSIALFVWLSCSFAAIAEEPMRLPVDDSAVVILRDGMPIAQFDIEIAATTAERSNGLMHRRDLPKDRGMLFVFEDEGMRYFWMENTPTPLDILYMDNNGRIVHVAADTVPFSRVPIPSMKPARYALEIHAGLSAAFNIRVGDQISHSVIGTE